MRRVAPLPVSGSPASPPPYIRFSMPVLVPVTDVVAAISRTISSGGEAGCDRISGLILKKSVLGILDPLTALIRRSFKDGVCIS